MIQAGHWEQLQRELSGELRRDELRRYLLGTDGSIFEKIPLAVVYPKTPEDVRAVVRFAAQHGIAVHSRGAGSGLAGAAIGQGLVLDFTKFMHRLIELDEERKSFTCQPGFRMGELEETLAGTGLFFPPDPSSGEYATFGGMFGTNASGAHSVKYGNVADYVLDAQVVLADGSLVWLSDIRETPYQKLPPNLQSLYQLYIENQNAIASAYPDTRYNTAGYNLRGLVKEGRLDLRKLLAGSEGTLAITTQLRFRLLDKPAYDSLVVAYMDDIQNSARAVQNILPMTPSGIEVMDKSLLALAREEEPALRSALPADVDNILLIEFDGHTPAECERQADAVQALLSEQNLCQRVHMAVSAGEKARFWSVRKAAVPILYKLKSQKKILALIEDAAVPTDNLAKYFKGIYKILNQHGVKFVTYGHIAKGLLHTRPLLDLKDGADVALLKTLADEVFELVHGLGGSVSGEHGDGRLRSAYVRRQFPDIHPLFLQTKALLDPDHTLNPEIICFHDPDQMTKDLRYGPAYSAVEPKDKILNWHGGMVPEIEMCHGCSKCSTVTHATRMCPVYKVTRDEAATPKAKANLLRALVSGRLPDRALFQSAFQGVMAQCVACGSCARECPSHVDIPKMALEAKARYAAKYGVLLADQLLALPEESGRFLGPVSAWIKPVADLGFCQQLKERFTGLSANRPFPRFDPHPLSERIRSREGQGDMAVLYFAGCYAGFMRPSIGEALVKTLTAMNMSVWTPAQHCCGLPLLSKGLADAAREKVRANLGQWESMLSQVQYIVVSCSSCGLSLMREWGDLLDSARIREIGEKTVHVSDLINRYFDRLPPLQTQPLRLAYHSPCHLRVQPRPDSSLRLLSRIPGIRIADLKAHCCGMAGSWGLRADHDELSRAIGSDLIGRLEASDADYGVTDCPTCRLQMEELGTKEVKHPVEVLRGSLEEG